MSMAKYCVEDPSEDDYGRVCCQCLYSCCNPTNPECNNHPIDKDRWCHKHHKSVWNLEDASNCKDFFD